MSQVSGNIPSAPCQVSLTQALYIPYHPNPNTKTLNPYHTGFTILRNVYSLNGTLFLVTEGKRSLPNLKYIISAYAEVLGGKTLADLPTQEHIRIIDHNAAIRLFGFSARELRGTTWFCNDPIACGPPCIYARATTDQHIRHR